MQTPRSVTRHSSAGSRQRAIGLQSRTSGFSRWSAYIYDGYGMMNYHYVHAVLDSSTRTDSYALTVSTLAGSCMSVAY